MAYKSKDVQSTTKFTGKVFDMQVAQADADQKVMQVTKGKREIGEFIENLDGNPLEDRRAGRPAPLPRGGAK